MSGRYGTDQLTMGLLIAGMVLTFIGDSISSSILILLTYVIFGACLFRIMSRNIAARQKENKLFLKYWSPVKTSLKQQYNKLTRMRTYKYLKCPNCKQKMRVPKGRGKIAVTCQKCNTKFISHS